MNCQSRTFFFKTCFDNQNKPVADTQAGACVQLLTSAQREKVTKLMRNAHAVAKHCAPFTHYELMTDDFFTC